MQTFLPFPDFAESARVLDTQRLGKQRVECAQLIKAIESKGGWSSHPAAHMWTGHIPALKVYMDAIVTEWVKRGYKNNYELNYPEGWWPEDDALLFFPPWLGDAEFHRSHRMALLKKSDHYDQFQWPELTDDSLPWMTPLSETYWWPRFDVAGPEELYVLRRKGDY